MASPQPVLQPPAIRRQARSQSTRVKLILAAEALFGEYGFDAVALRDICKAAEQRNSTVVQYHFGDKLGLLDAVFEHRAGQIDPIRQRMIAQARAAGRLDDVKTLLRLAMEPEFEICRREGSFHYIGATIYYMLYQRPRGIPHPYDRHSPASASLREVVGLLHRRLDFLPAERVEFRVSTANTLILSVLMMMSQRVGGGEPLEILLEDTLDMMTAAILAPAAGMPSQREKTQC